MCEVSWGGSWDEDEMTAPKRNRRMNKMRIIVTMMLLALAVLGALFLGPKATTAGGGIGFPGEHHVFLPIIQHSPGCPRGCFSPWEGSVDPCWIKGVVTGMGNWLYYTPDMSNWCEAMLLTFYKGRWFCTEDEAMANGFVKATLRDWYWPETAFCQAWKAFCKTSPDLCRFSLMERLEQMGWAPSASRCR